MAPKTRAMAAEKNKGKKKKQVSFTDDPSPFSPLQPSLPPPPSPFLQPSSTFTDNANPFSPLQLHPAVAAPPPIPSPLPPCPAASPPPIPSPSPSPFTLASSFRTISSRISTYTHWPHQKLSPVKLAAAGFRRTFGIGKDRVKCVFCGVEVYNWDNVDCPM